MNEGLRTKTWQSLEVALAEASGEIRGIMLTKEADRNPEQRKRLDELRQWCKELGEARYAAINKTTWFTDNEVIDVVCRSGPQDCLQDPYDALKNGNAYSSVPLDIVKVWRMAESAGGTYAAIPFVSVEIMHNVAGFYEVVEYPKLSFKVEIDENGNCYQLTKDLKRDGMLKRDGWNTEVLARKIK